MDTFWIVTLFHLQPEAGAWEEIQVMAMEQFNAMGIEEYSLDEPEVDALLGERSYSGGDLPQEVLDEVDKTIHNRPSNYRFFFEKEEDAKGFKKQVASLILTEVQMEKQKSSDWNAEWKKHYSPIEVNDKLTIVPAWQKEYQARSQKQLLINPGIGFGTGSHETTFLCLKLFTEEVLGEKLNFVLDFGSGSGILGLAALKFYPEVKVDFYDIDPEANKNCYQNAEINQLTQSAFRLLLPDVRNKLQSEYELVFANILENILILEQNELIRMTKPGGALILSGLLKHQVAGVIKLYSQEINFIKEVQRGDWSALLFRKKA